MDWEKTYKGTECVWGKRPDALLQEYLEIIPEGKVLDLGLGEGRNALLFASRGYEVEGVDASHTAVCRCIEFAEEHDLKITAQVGDLREFAIPEGRYSLIIAAWVLNFFSKSEAEQIAAKMRKGLEPGGFVYLSVFNPHDPGYERATRESEPVDENTFYLSSRGLHMHYFTAEEVRSLFSDLETIHFSEGIHLDTGHAKPHYHGFIQYMGRRTA